MNKKEESLHKDLRTYLSNNISYLTNVRILVDTLEKLEKIQLENEQIEQTILEFNDKIRPLSFLQYGENLINKTKEINKHIKALIK